MKKLGLFFVSGLFSLSIYAQDADKILADIDKNLSAESRIMESTMIVHGMRSDRIMTSKSYTVGVTKSFTEYLSPARDKGTKMLKLEKEMWMYSPSTDRTVMVSGHMLRQSVMGSDLSYEDMMDDRKLSEIYTPKVVGEETYDGRKCYVMELTSKVSDAAYHSQKMWVDVERNVPLKQELYAKSGQLLKKVELSDFQKIDGRWFSMKMNYKDMLKEGKGTDWVITKIEFNVQIPSHIFSKAGLKQ